MKQIRSIILLTGFIILLSGTLSAQEEQPYNPTLDAHEQLSKAIKQAGNEGKHVFVMIGGNW